MKNEAQDNPGVIAPPPLIYLVGLLAGVTLHKALLARLLPSLPRLPRLAVGSALLGLAGTIVNFAFRLMIQKKTNVDPRLPATTLVKEGPFRFTRNPLYLSMTLFFIGLSILFDALGSLLVLPFVLSVMRRGVIDREERYLERKFGKQYLQYKSRVRRWL